jgi:hypothetical protein
MLSTAESQARAVSHRWEPRPVRDSITAIVPTVGRPTLERCLQSIVTGSVWPARIIVVDQGSNPAAAAWLGRLDAVGLKTLRVQSMERSPASARNEGIQLVDTPFVAAIEDRPA